MESKLIDILTRLLDEYKTHSKTELDKLVEIESTLLSINDLLSKGVQDTQKLNQMISEIQDNIIDLKYR